jgi:hypothetical protein
MSHRQGEEGHSDVAEGDETQHRAGRRETGPEQAEEEATAWSEETSFQPSTNQMRDEPMPAGHHAPRGQEAEVRSEQQATDEAEARPSGKVRERDGQ